MRLLAKAYGARWVRKTGHRSPMDTPRDNQDRFMKLMLSRPRMVRDLLALLPAEWTAAVDAASLRELPTEFIGERGDKRIADLCWLDLRDPAAQYPKGGNRMAAMVMREASALERNIERWLERHRRDAYAEGRRKGLADGLREGLVRLASRRFGADTGRRLEARLRAIEDPGRLERVGVLIVECETGEQLLGGIDGSGMNSS